MLSGFASAPTKQEGAGVVFDQATETFTARYTHETIALAFAITEEAIEDNLTTDLQLDTLEHLQDLCLTRSK